MWRGCLQQARDQASAHGYKPIDLIDGERLVELLIERRIGIKDVTVVDADFSRRSSSAQPGSRPSTSAKERPWTPPARPRRHARKAHGPDWPAMPLPSPQRHRPVR